MSLVYERLVILFMLNGLDYITTILALDKGASEGNPITRLFISRNSLHYFKIIGLVAVSFILIRGAKKDRSMALMILKWANLGYGLIVIINCIVLVLQITQK